MEMFNQMEPEKNALANYQLRCPLGFKEDLTKADGEDIAERASS